MAGWSPRSVTWIRLWAACLLVSGLSLALTAAPALGAKAALLPLEGDGLLTKTRQDLDGELRAALLERGLEVQSREATEAQISEAQSAGLGNCPPSSDVCARRVGKVAEVDVVVRASVELWDERMVLRASWLDVQSQSPARKVAGQFRLPALDGGKSLRAVVRRLVSGKGDVGTLPFQLKVIPPDADVFLDGKRIVAGVQWLPPGEHKLLTRAEGHADLERTLLVNADGEGNEATVALTPFVVEVPVMRYVGLGLLGVGGLALLGGAVGASVIEGSLYAPQAYSQRSALQTAGKGALITTAGGAAAAAVGGVFVVAGAGE